MISIKIDDEMLLGKMDRAQLLCGDLDQPLRRFGRHLKARAIERYKRQDFAPLAASTIEARARKGLGSLEGKLRSDVKKAIKKQEKTKASRGLLQAALNSLGASAGGGLLETATSRGARTRLAVLEEFRRRHRKGSSRLMSAGGVALSVKQLASLGKRTDRAVAKAVGKPILGGLPGTLELEVGYGSVTVRSHTDRPWTATHNDGGSAGKGAQIPQRETLKVEQEDEAVLAGLIREHILQAFEE